MTTPVNVKGPCDQEVIRNAPPPDAGLAPKTSNTGPGLWVLVATILGSSMAFIDGTVVNVALPRLQTDLGATSTDAQWVVEAYSLFLAALILVGGSLGDRLGRKRIYAIGIGLFTVASVACGLAPIPLTLIVARAVQGIGGALLVPGSLAIIAATFGGAERGRAIGTWSGFTTITSAIGPVLGGWLVQNISWRAVFFLNIPIAAATLFLVFLHVPESRDDEGVQKLDVLGAVLVTVGLGLSVFGLIQWQAVGLGNAVVLTSLIGGIVILGLFVLVESRLAHPMMPLGLFRSRTFSGANLLTLFLYGALGGALYFLPFNLQQVQGYTATEAGASLLPFTFILFALSRWAGGLVDKVGPRLPLTIGPLITAVGFVLFAFSGVGGSYWTSYFPAIVVMSLGMSLVVAPLTTAVMGAVDQQRSGVASGINNAVSRTAGLLAIAVLGIVVSATFGRTLDTRLSAGNLPAALVRSVGAQSGKLAGIVVPRSAPVRAAATVRQDVKESFVDGFRVAMLVAAALSALSAGAALFLIEGKRSTRAPQNAAKASSTRPDMGKPHEQQA